MSRYKKPRLSTYEKLKMGNQPRQDPSHPKKAFQGRIITGDPTLDEKLNKAVPHDFEASGKARQLELQTLQEAGIIQALEKTLVIGAVDAAADISSVHDAGATHIALLDVFGDGLSYVVNRSRFIDQAFHRDLFDIPLDSDARYDTVIGYGLNPKAFNVQWDPTLIDKDWENTKTAMAAVRGKGKPFTGIAKRKVQEAYVPGNGTDNAIYALLSALENNGNYIFSFKIVGEALMAASALLKQVQYPVWVYSADQSKRPMEFGYLVGRKNVNMGVIATHFPLDDNLFINVPVSQYRPKRQLVETAALIDASLQIEPWLHNTVGISPLHISGRQKPDYHGIVPYPEGVPNLQEILAAYLYAANGFIRNLAQTVSKF